MIRYYIKTSRDSKLREIKNIVRGCWIYIVNPEKKEIDKMVKKLGVSRDFITDPLDENERSRIEVDGDNIFIVFRIPHYVNKKILTMPLGIIITKSYFVTVSINKNVILDDFLKEKVKGFYTTKKTRFLLQIFARVNKYYISYLHEVERMVKDIEKGLAYSFKNEKIISLLELEKILVYFNTSVISNGNVMERIFRGNIIRLYEEDQDLLEDIIIENKQAIEMINIYTNILTSSMDAYASIISNNLNVIMKFLTSVTIIISIPTMIASFYGMNVSLPFQNNSNAFLITLFLSLILSGVMAYIFRKKEWL